MKFRVIRGLHNQGNKLYGPREPNGKPCPGTVGDTFDSVVDMVKLHGPTKFERVYEKVEPEQSATDDVGSMTVAQLKAFAKENGIDLGEATKRDDILDIVLANTT